MSSNRPAPFTLSSIFLLITIIGVLLGLLLPARPALDQSVEGFGAVSAFCGLPVGIVCGAGQQRRGRGMLVGGLVGLIAGVAAAFIFMQPPGLSTVAGGCAVLLITAAVFRNRD